jgi:drug/metabolite transporter (DMT)-like permease
MLTCSALMMLPASLILERPWEDSPGAVALGSVAALGLLCTALAYVLYFRILATAGATNLLLCTFLIPVGALLLGMLLLGERPGWNAFAGMALVFAGLACIDGRLLRRGGGIRRPDGSSAPRASAARHARGSRASRHS